MLDIGQTRERVVRHKRDKCESELDIRQIRERVS